MIIIGVPPGLNGTVCPSGTCNQRYYEYTPTDCEPSVSQCTPSQPSGGGDIFLQFVSDNVIPAVFTELNLDQGEIAISGFR
jgi:predicted alpha/beta superfamily hydrolase